MLSFQRQGSTKIIFKSQELKIAIGDGGQTDIHATFITFTNGKNQNKISDYAFAEERKVNTVGVVRCTCTQTRGVLGQLLLQWRFVLSGSFFLFSFSFFWTMVVALTVKTMDP